MASTIVLELVRLVLTVVDDNVVLELSLDVLTEVELPVVMDQVVELSHAKTSLSPLDALFVSSQVLRQPQ
jgi:hypothetical protein